VIEEVVLSNHIQVWLQMAPTEPLFTIWLPMRLFSDHYLHVGQSIFHRLNNWHYMLSERNPTL
jgi:hypothetical protein